MRTRLRVAIALAAAAALIPVGVSAADTSATQAAGVASDTVWVVVAAVLVLFMQAGFAMLEVGFARAFLPHEFARFGVSVNESKARFAEGMEQVRQLLEQEQVASDGTFHRFPPTTSLPT